jgi:hypothetical protein
VTQLKHNEKHKAKTPAQDLFDAPVYIELTITPDQSFYDVLLNSIDKAFSSLGDSAKTAIYFHLENLFEIKKLDIPFRIDDFQNALERLFGIGSRHLEILFIKNLHEELNTPYKCDMPRLVVTDITFQEYLQRAKMDFENSIIRNKEQDLGDEGLE